MKKSKPINYCKSYIAYVLCYLGFLFISNGSFAQFQYQQPLAPSTMQLQQEQQLRIQQQNREVMQRMGFTPPPTQAEIVASQQRHIHGKAPEPTKHDKIQIEVNSLLVEANKEEKKRNEADYYHSSQYLDDLPKYIEAKQIISNMLLNKGVLSIKDAYYVAEAAYGNLLLAKNEYDHLIQSNASFIKQWLVENKYSSTNPEMLHYGIQKFISETLYIKINGVKTGHMPYYYDYIDFAAKEDKRNYFVTKTLASGTGQCHTFPITYLILAEALNIEAYLAFNPQHSFVRYKNSKGTLINYETTVDRFLGDAFYLQTLPVMAKAQKNKLYIQNLTKKQVVASVLYDLAANFIREHWTADRVFIKECMDIAKPYFPNQSYISNTESYLHQRFYADDINAMVQAHGIKNVSELEKYPNIVKAYQNYYAYMQKVSELGIQEFPEAEELRMLEYADKKGRLQVAKKINAKEKKSLFIN